MFVSFAVPDKNLRLHRVFASTSAATVEDATPLPTSNGSHQTPNKVTKSNESRDLWSRVILRLPRNAVYFFSSQSKGNNGRSEVRDAAAAVVVRRDY
jgi:hypothetical protein